MAALSVVFVPNWEVRTGATDVSLLEADRWDDQSTYRFFRRFSTEPNVRVIGTASVLNPRLQERFLHFYPLQAGTVLSALRKYGADVLIFHGAQSAVGVLSAARAFRVPLPPTVVFDVGCLNAGRPDRRIQFALTRWALEEADAIIWHSTASRRFCERICPTLAQKGRYIPFGVNPDEFPPSAVEASPPYAVAVGSADRDWTTLAQAFHMLPDVPLVLVGGGGGVSAWPANVTVLPRMPFAEYLDLVRQSRLCVLPLKDSPASYGQMTLLQAFAMEKPVVTSDVGPVRDYLGPWAFPVPPSDPVALAAAIETLWARDDARRELGRAARRAVVERFNETQMGTAVEVTVRTLLGSSEPGGSQGKGTAGPR